jgi:AraC-like DNA-binding protein/mannose-6-phosphate isomerase-like protein (cupin superfamily)
MKDCRFRAKRSEPDIDRIARPVIALTDEYPPGFVDPRHAHRRAQLLFATAGVMAVVTDGGSYVVPPQRAVWLPAGTEHEVSCRGQVSLRTLYFESNVCEKLPSRSLVIEISDFLRALILEVTKFRADYDVDGREGRIVRLIVDEIQTMPQAPFHAPMPRDERLAKVCRAILSDPARGGNLDDWARLAGMGRRTLTRTFRADTGMSFAAWRQQARLLEALSLLAIGRSVTAVAYDVGYDSPSAFTASFHRTFGLAPSQYFAKH